MHMNIYSFSLLLFFLTDSAFAYFFFVFAFYISFILPVFIEKLNQKWFLCVSFDFGKKDFCMPADAEKHFLMVLFFIYLFLSCLPLFINSCHVSCEDWAKKIKKKVALYRIRNEISYLCVVEEEQKKHLVLVLLSFLYMICTSSFILCERVLDICFHVYLSASYLSHSFCCSLLHKTKTKTTKKK